MTFGRFVCSLECFEYFGKGRDPLLYRHNKTHCKALVEMFLVWGTVIQQINGIICLLKIFSVRKFFHKVTS